MLNLQATGGIRKPVRAGSGISRKVVQPETLGAAGVDLRVTAQLVESPASAGALARA